MPPENITDISGRGWDDLSTADRDELQELAGERDGIDGRWANEALAAALLAYDGRVDEVPDADAEEYADEVEAALEGSANPDAEVEHTDDENDDETPVEDNRETDTEDDEGTGRDQKIDNAGSPDETVTEDASFIIDATTLEDWLGYPDVLVDESKVHIEADGLRIRAVDPANVGMIDTKLYDTAFESYPTVREEGLIGVNLERFKDIVEMADTGDLIHIEYVAETRNLVVSHSGQEFTMALIDPDSIRKEPDIPDLDLPARVEFEEADSLKRFVTGADMVSDHITLGVDADELAFYAEADGDTDDWYGEYLDGEEIDIVLAGEARSVYSLDYLKDIAGSSGSSGAFQKDRPLEIDLGVEFPFDLRQTIYADDDEVGEAQFLLAPRIQSD